MYNTKYHKIDEKNESIISKIVALMYNNIGEKIKGVAKTTFIVEALASIIAGIVLWVDTGEALFALLLFGGPMVALVSSWILYGYGEIIDTLYNIEKNNSCNQSKLQAKDKAEKSEKVTAKKEKQEVAARARREAMEKEKQAAMDRELANIKYIDTVCPKCHRKLSFYDGTVEAQCPFCDRTFRLDE